MPNDEPKTFADHFIVILIILAIISCLMVDWKFTG